MNRHHQDSLLDAVRQGEEGQEKKAMKLPRSPVIWCVLIVCLTLLAFTYLTRKSLCEIRLKDGEREVAAILAYESAK